MAAMLKMHVTFSRTGLISSLKETLLNKITEITNILNQADATVTKTLPFGNLKYFGEVNLQILNVIIDFTLTSKRFDEPHLNF